MNINHKNKIQSRLFSLLAVLALIASILLPAFGNVASAQTVASGQSTGTTVHIHKLQADSYDETRIPADNENGAALTQQEIENLGTNVQGLEGVTFTAYRVADTTTPQDVQDGNYTINESEGIVLGTTNEDGIVTWQAPASGSFVVKETGRPDTVSSSIAVPFLIQFPMANEQGQTLSEVHIYPKNLTSDIPSIHKAVDTLTGQSQGYDIGENFNWYLKSTIPANLDVYESFVFQDELDSALDYQSVTVVAGDETLVAGQDYELTAPEQGNAGGEVTVSLTSVGRNKVHQIGQNGTAVTADDLAGAGTNASATAFIEVQIETSINETAVMGKPIQNNFTLNYDNTNDGTANPKSLQAGATGDATSPSVHTGGKRFIKTNDADVGLENAQFHVFRSGGEQINWTADLITANSTQASGAQAGDPIVLTSGTDGAFDIRGLAYDGENGTSYYLQEIQAPQGYVALQGNIDFTVNQTSYNTQPTQIDTDAANGQQGAADPQKIVNNQRPTIPATGGIGSIIFIVLGLALIAVAYYGYQKSKVDA